MLRTEGAAYYQVHMKKHFTFIHAHVNSIFAVIATFFFISTSKNKDVE
jgi:hypothetical protein